VDITYDVPECFEDISALYRAGSKEHRPDFWRVLKIRRIVESVSLGIHMTSKSSSKLPKLWPRAFEELIS